VYKVSFNKPIDFEVVVDFDLLAISHRDAAAMEMLGLIAKEGWQRAHIGEYHSHKQALSKYTLSAILLSEPVLKMVRKQLRVTAPGLKTDLDQIKKVIEEEVLKREILEGERALSAQRQVKRATKRSLKKRTEQSAAPEQSSIPGEAQVPVVAASSYMVSIPERSADGM